MPQTVQQTLQDPKFYGLPSGEQQKVLATLDPNYARLPLEERNKVLTMGRQKWGGGVSPDAATSPPDLTTNSVNPETGTGYGLYDLVGPNGPEKIPFNKVPIAMMNGYRMASRGTGMRYQDDVAATQPSWFQRVTTPTSMNPNTTPADSSWPSNRDAAWNAAVNALNVGGNVLKRGARTAIGGLKFPFQAVKAVDDSFSSDPETSARAEDEILAMHPGAQIYDRLVEDRDTRKKDPMLANENIAGDVLGMWALEKVPGVVKYAGDKLARVPEAFRRTVTDTGAGPIKRLVADRIKANEVIDTNNTVAKSYNSAAEHTLEMRRQKEQELNQATQDYYAKEAAADTRAKGEENSAWSKWREKMAGKTVDGGQIAEQLKSIAAVSPETARLLRQLRPSPEEAPPDSLYAQDRAAIMKHQGYTGNYFDYPKDIRDNIDRIAKSSGFEPEPIDFDPQAGKPIPVEQVHRTSSILQRYIRSGRFDGPVLGEMKQVAKVLRASVTRASADAGAGGELAAARNATITYQDAFGRESHPPATSRLVREKQANPEAFRERADEERLDAARRYDPTLVDGYRQVKALREELKKLPTEDKLRKDLQPIVRRQTISSADIEAARRAAAEARAGKAQTRGTWVSTWPVFQAMRALWGGHIPSIPTMIMESAGTFATTKAATALMRYPPMIEFLTKARPEDVPLIPPDLRGDLPNLVNLAKSQGIKVSPALLAATAGVGANQRQSLDVDNAIRRILGRSDQPINGVQ